MKFALVVLAVVACVHADVSHIVKEEKSATVLRSVADVGPESFNYAYETSNKIAAQSEGRLKAVGDTAALEQQGSYQYVAPDGTPIQTSYVANELGYQPQGAHIPTPPPVPYAIVRALEWIAAHPPQVEKVYSRQ